MHELKVVRERRVGYGSCKRFRSSADVYESFREHFARLDREHFVVLLLDAKNLKPVVVHNDMVKEEYDEKALTKEVCEHIIRHSAAAVILLHNHPNGSY